MAIRTLRSWIRNTLARPARPARRRPRLDELEPRVNPANPYLVADINAVASTAASNPAGFVDLNGTAYFFAADAVHGGELWKSDGTPAGTAMVKDINPGTVGSNILKLTVVNGTLYFAADDGVHGQELWKSNGTEAGTVLVKDISPGAGSSTLDSLTDFNGTLFFNCRDGLNGPSGAELWKSDGTDAGTIQVKDINPGSGDSNPLSLRVFNNALYFAANDGTSGSELWKSDGTDTGTVRLKDINSGTAGSSPNFLTVVNGTLYFRARDSAAGYELWKTDGTDTGTVLVKDIRPGTSGSGPASLTNVNGTLFFRATDGSAGYELWKSDGTDTGTVIVKDINSGSGASNPGYFANVNGTLYFQASDGTNGAELWKSDGTGTGTVMVKDIRSGSATSNPGLMTNVNGNLFFRANNGAAGDELWTSDGTDGGTVMVKDIRSGANSAFPAAFGVVGSMLYFAADDGAHGVELWKSDGTANGTVLVKDILSGTSPSTPRYLTDVSGTLFFVASDGVHGPELWKSDGTAGGTAMVKDIWPGANGSFIKYLTNVNGTLFFRADNGTSGYELWKSDGSEGGTVMVKDINPTSYSKPSSFAVMNGTLYFAANDGSTGQELWKSDGTDTGTVRVKDINPGSASSQTQNLAVMNGVLYFGADNGTTGNELWKSDGTETGTALLKDTRPGGSAGFPEKLTAVGNMLFFAAFDSTNGKELWMSDGTDTGTALVKDIRPGTGSSSPTNLTAVGDALYFVADDGVNGQELWVSKGTPGSTTLVKDILTGLGASQPNNLLNWNGTLYFSADDFVDGRELWKTDGTSPGTVHVQGDSPSVRAIGVGSLALADGTLYFGAYDRSAGGELWKTDGTADGTIPLGQIVPGTGSSNPNRLAAAGGRLYFAATSEDSGEELWALPIGRNVSFAAASQSGSEGSGTMTVTAQLSEAAAQDVTVPFTVSGTATDGVDFTITASPITIPAGSLTGTATITILDDPTDEDDETVVVTMGEPTNAFAGDVIVDTATIVDDDDPPTVSFATDSGSADEGVATRTVTINLSAPSGKTVTVPFSLSGTATNPEDFTNSPTNSLTFAPGEVSKSITLTVVDDTLDEADETVDLTLGTPTNATLGATTTYTETIVDDDAAPTVAFTSSGGSATENVATRTVTIALSAESGLPITVPYSVSGTATNPDDYSIAPASPLTFAPGETSKTITITVVDDALYEPDETVVLTLDTPTNATIGAPDTYTETILQQGGIIVSPPSAKFTTEAGGTVTFAVVLNTVPSADVVIPISSSDLTEATVSASQLVFTPANAGVPQTVTVTGLDDAVVDFNQAYTVVLGAAQSADPRFNGIDPADIGLVNVELFRTRKFVDIDGDKFTVTLTGPGQVGVIQTPNINGPGSIDQLILSGTNPLLSRFTVGVVKVVGGNGFLDIGTATGPGILSFTAPKCNLVGEGVLFNGYLGTLRVRDINNGADIIAGGTPTPRTTIVAADVGDGTTIDLGSGINTLRVKRFGAGEITAPRIGTLSVTGAPIRSIPGDFAADVRLTGAGVLPGTKALGSMVVAGTIRGSAIEVAGNVGSIQTKAMVDSSLLLGQSGTMQPGFKLGTFAATGFLGSPTPAYVDSTITADLIGRVTLKSVATNHPDQTFGVAAGTSLVAVKVTTPPFSYNLSLPSPQGLNLDQDVDLEFVVRVGP